jgi:hypothetical protein
MLGINLYGKANWTERRVVKGGRDEPGCVRFGPIDYRVGKIDGLEQITVQVSPRQFIMGG